MFNSLLPIVAVVLVIFLLFVVFIKVIPKQKAQEAQNYPYEKLPSLFSPAERSFLGVLELADNGRYCFMRIPTQVATRFRFISPPDSDLSRHPIPGEVAT